MVDSQRATITENMVPYRKFAENQSIEDETSDCDQYKSGDEKSASSKSSPKEDTRRFNVSSKADLVNLIYKDSPSANRVADDSDEDWSAGFPINDNSPLLTNDAIPLQKHKSQRFSRKDYENDDDDDDEYSVGLKPGKNESESLLGTSIQVFIPFLIAGFGTVGAGLVLDVVQHWDVFKNITEVFILVPALLGLKGNLEMTLASRLSTQANLGNMNSAIEQWRMASGNIALIQCQAAVVGFLAALFAIIMDWLPEGEFNLSHSLLLCASSLLTASIASFLLGILMVFVIICSRKCNINPDNIATPIAASLGDLTTLALLAFISNLLYYTIDTSIWLSVVLILIFLLLIPVWCIIAARNKYTRDVLYTGWTPVIAAMAISSLGGCILDFAVSRFKGVAVFQPVINGVGGNLVAVQSSRISTYLHRTTKLGTLPRDDNVLCLSPCSAFFRNSIHAKTAVILLMMVVPGHLVFSYGIKLLQAGHTSITFTFLLVYLSAALLQVFILLYLAHVMIFWMWTRKIDPDNSAIPYLTAIGDLLGTGLLALAFLFLYNIGDKDADVGD